MNIIQALKRWIKLWIYNYKVISASQARELGLTPHINVYGDAINYLNCRSLWVDEYDSNRHLYRVKELIPNTDLDPNRPVSYQKLNDHRTIKVTTVN